MTTPLGESFKGIGIQDEEFNGKNLRVLIVQARCDISVLLRHTDTSPLTSSTQSDGMLQ